MRYIGAVHRIIISQHINLEISRLSLQFEKFPPITYQHFFSSKQIYRSLNLDLFKTKARYVWKTLLEFISYSGNSQSFAITSVTHRWRSDSASLRQ
jgi:hypothetical protein